MVLESLISPLNAERHPKEMIIFGIIYSLVAAIISFWVFYAYSSVVMVFLTTIAAAPLIYKIIRNEEKKDTEDYSEKSLLFEHSKALSAMMWFFIGVTILMTSLVVVLPIEKTDVLFEAQKDTITQINGQATSTSFFFKKIFFNNLKVMVFCILFSFLYGIGALFILNWNASVIAVALGSFIKVNLPSVGVGAIGLGVLRYSIHGIPEIMAYIVAGLAGGIISVAMIRYDTTTKKWEKILFDTSNLLLISIFTLIIAAILEVYVTPAFFS